MEWYWIAVLMTLCFCLGFCLALLITERRKNEEKSDVLKIDRLLHTQINVLLPLLLVLMSACTTVNCPETEATEQAWIHVEVLDVIKSAHTVPVVVHSIARDETGTLTPSDTLELAFAQPLLGYRTAQLVIEYDARWELIEVLEVE